ncbi:MAG: hypothetical protein J7454_18645, partial [Roseiflexus sp.]|nr:hypothetical protein [Roseiflexus sp.]
MRKAPRPPPFAGHAATPAPAALSAHDRRGFCFSRIPAGIVYSSRYRSKRQARTNIPPQVTKSGFSGLQKKKNRHLTCAKMKKEDEKIVTKKS